MTPIATVTALQADVPRLLAHLDFPASHWKHIRSTNPIESTFATVKLRTRATKGAGSRVAGLTIAFKLLKAAQGTWRRLDATTLLPLIRAGVVFTDGQMATVERAGAERKEEGWEGRRLIICHSQLFDNISLCYDALTKYSLWRAPVEIRESLKKFAKNGLIRGILLGFGGVIGTAVGTMLLNFVWSRHRQLVMAYVRCSKLASLGRRLLPPCLVGYQASDGISSDNIQDRSHFI